MSQATESLASCRTALEMIAAVASEDVVRRLALVALESLTAASQLEVDRRARDAVRKRDGRQGRLDV